MSKSTYLLAVICIIDLIGSLILIGLGVATESQPVFILLFGKQPTLAQIAITKTIMNLIFIPFFEINQNCYEYLKQPQLRPYFERTYFKRKKQPKVWRLRCWGVLTVFAYLLILNSGVIQLLIK